MTTRQSSFPSREEHHWDKLFMASVEVICLLVAIYRIAQAGLMATEGRFDKAFFVLLCESLCLTLALCGFNSSHWFLIIPLSVYTGISAVAMAAYAIEGPLWWIVCPEYMDFCYINCVQTVNTSSIPNFYEDVFKDCLAITEVSSSTYYAPLYQCFIFYFATAALIDILLIKVDTDGPPMFQSKTCILWEAWWYWMPPITNGAFMLLVVYSAGRMNILRFFVNKDEEFYLILFFLCFASFSLGWFLEASFLMLPILGYMLVSLCINLDSSFSLRKFALHGDDLLNNCMFLIKSTTNVTSIINCFTGVQGKTFYDFIRPAWTSFILVFSITFCVMKFRKIYRV